MREVKYKSSGVSVLLNILTIVFVVLKLTGNINWSWWWVLSPIWITASFAIVILIAFWIKYKLDHRS